MSDKTIVLRKADHWYVISSGNGDENEIMCALLEYAEATTYNIEPDDVHDLARELGWTLEVHSNLNAA